MNAEWSLPLFCAVPVFPQISSPGTAAMMAVAPHWEEGQTTVGTALNIEHSKATKVGEVITATAVLTEINGRELKFNIAARDQVSIIGEGTHSRFIVNREKFMAKLG